MTDTAYRPPTVRMVALVALVALVVLGAVALRTRSGLVFVKYPAAAEMVLEGTLRGERMIDFSPLYLELHVAAMRYLPAPKVAFLAGQTVLAAVAIALLFVVLRRRVSTRLALVGAASLMLNRNLLVHQSILEPEIVLLFLVLTFLVLVARPGRWSALGAGVAGALALATRPNLLPVLGLVPVAFLFAHRGRGWVTGGLLGSSRDNRAGALRHIVVRSALFALPVVLTIGLLMVRSAQATGNPLAPAMNPGTVFFEGNNPLSFGTSAIYPAVVSWLVQQPSREEAPDRAHQYYRDIARVSTGQPLTVSQVNGYWRDRATAFIRAEPLRWLRLELGKITLAFHNSRFHDVSVAWRIERELGLLPSVPFALVGALALVGLLIEAPRWRSALLLYALLGSQLATMLVFYVSARQRVVLLPAALYFAVVALERFAMPRRRLYVMLAVLLVLCLVLPHPLVGELGHRLRYRLEVAASTHELQEAFLKEPPAWHLDAVVDRLAAVPDQIEHQRPAFLPNEGPTVYELVLRAVESRDSTAEPDLFDLATAQLAAGRAVAADASFAALEAAGFTPYRQSMSTHVATYRGRAAALRGDSGAVEGHLRRALEQSPGDPFALALLVAQTGDEAARRNLFAYWSRAGAELLLGRASLDLGKPEQALEHLEWITRAVPSLRLAQVDLAAALGAVGRFDEGARRYLSQHARSVDPIARDPAIPQLFRAWQAADPRPERRLVAAKILHAYGYLREALEMLAALEAEAASEQGPGLRAAGPSRLSRDVLRETAAIRRALSSAPNGS